MAYRALPHAGSGRHRYGRADRVYCRDLPATRDFYAMHARPRRWWAIFSVTRSRHSMSWLRRHGKPARPAFALIMSL